MKTAALLGVTLGFAIASFATPAEAQERGRRYDRAFLDTMVQHHHETLDLAASTGQSITNPELRDYLRSIRHHRGRELSRLEHWRDEWFGDAPVRLLPDSPPPLETEELEGTPPGGHYDLMVLNLLVRHLEDGVRIARDALARARHDDIHALAEQVIDLQERELEQLRAWQSNLAAEVRAYERHMHRHRR
jgi:uncharacterized protein (DUF305 family)